MRLSDAPAPQAERARRGEEASPTKKDRGRLEIAASHPASASTWTVCVPVQVGSRQTEGSALSLSYSRINTGIGADLVVIGMHGRTGLAYIRLGSVTEFVGCACAPFLCPGSVVRLRTLLP